jgi:hypothetical protein
VVRRLQRVPVARSLSALLPIERGDELVEELGKVIPHVRQRQPLVGRDLALRPRRPLGRDVVSLS